MYPKSAVRTAIQAIDCQMHRTALHLAITRARALMKPCSFFVSFHKRIIAYEPFHQASQGINYSYVQFVVRLLRIARR